MAKGKVQLRAWPETQELVRELARAHDLTQEQLVHAAVSRFKRETGGEQVETREQRMARLAGEGA